MSDYLTVILHENFKIKISIPIFCQTAYLNFIVEFASLRKSLVMQSLKVFFILGSMADREVQIELSKMRVELKKLLQSSVAIFEEVQGQNPTTWDQFSEMMRTEAESSDLDEREQSLEMSWRSSLDALGINTNYSLEVSVNSQKRVYGENVVSTLTLR